MNAQQLSDINMILCHIAAFFSDHLVGLENKACLISTGQTLKTNQELITKLKKYHKLTMPESLCHGSSAANFL